MSDINTPSPESQQAKIACFEENLAWERTAWEDERTAREDERTAWERDIKILQSQLEVKKLQAKLKEVLKLDEEPETLTQWPLCVTAQTMVVTDEGSIGSHVHIWNYDTLHLLNSLGEFTDNAACITLSKVTEKGLTILAVVKNGNKSKLSLWTINGTGDEPVSKIVLVVAGADHVHSLEFHPMDHNTMILTGKGFVTLWTLKDGPDGATMDRSQGLFTRKIPRPKSVLCSKVDKNGDLLTGDLDGGLSDGAFVVFDNRYQLIGAGATLPDVFGCVRRILQKTYDINEDEVLYCRLVVGTSRNCILDVSFNVSPGETEISNFEIKPIVQVHAKEIFHIANIPGQDQFLSCGEDRSVICWDGVAHKADWKMSDINTPSPESPQAKIARLEETLARERTAREDERTAWEREIKILRSQLEVERLQAKLKEALELDEDPETLTLICWDGVAHKADWVLEVSETSLTSLATAFDGHFALAGSDDGKIFYIPLNSDNIPEKEELMDFKEGISCISLSPTEYLAIIGTDDGELHCVEIMLDSDDKANHLSDLNGHSSKVKHIDWSDDGNYLRTNSADHELLYWVVNQMTQVTDSEDLDVITEWASHTCPLDFNSLAIWTRIDDGTDINSCDASQDMLVIGDDRGFVLIYPYPATQPRSELMLFI
ncbi:hypothetical protein TCAL_03039 [Tigriopus californicus]|uniref:Uncharacterized protein n=1 Tax=Tigriopus californicus TaxID=6832 RepID=A0A553NVJ5_TIGCA|nr:hypothetical protein TCAL_03039 [Tigriopus californicus]